jgi:hypothetical protein
MGLPMHLKKAKISMSDSKTVENTKILDGEAKDSPAFESDNVTEQYTTPALPKNDLGGRNDPNG